MMECQNGQNGQNDQTITAYPSEKNGMDYPVEFQISDLKRYPDSLVSAMLLDKIMRDELSLVAFNMPYQALLSVKYFYENDMWGFNPFIDRENPLKTIAGIVNISVEKYINDFLGLDANYPEEEEGDPELAENIRAANAYCSESEEEEYYDEYDDRCFCDGHCQCA